MKILLISLLLFVNVWANNLYFLPKESAAVKARIIKEIRLSRESIKISVYNFSYKKIAKELIKAKKKRNIDIRVFLDYKKVKKDDSIFKMLKKAGIKCTLINKKLHVKMFLFDKDILMFGSMNLTKESFKNNYEVVMFSDDSKDIKKAQEFFKNSLRDK